MKKPSESIQEQFNYSLVILLIIIIKEQHILEVDSTNKEK